MKQERLTREGIRTDMEQQRKSGYVALVFLSVFAVALAAFGLWIGHFGGVVFVLYGVLLGVLALVVLVALGAQVRAVVTFRRLLEQEPHVYRDKVVKMEEKEHRSRYSTYTTYHLYFAGFGEYQIPDSNYAWTEEFGMSSYGLYQFTSLGDEFYLVLSKPHTGKVLLAYSDRLFTLTPEGNAQ